METETQQRVAALTKFEATKQKAARLLAQNKITLSDIEALDQLEKDYLAETCTQKLAQLSGAERDNFLDKIAPVIAPTTNTDIWELNHAAISGAIAGYMQQYGSMPQKSVIAEQTGISRKTIAKHIAAYKTQPEFTAQMEQFQFMTPKVLASVFKRALKGDVRAARLYLEMVGATKQQAHNTTAFAQNNNIQINNTILSQDNLNQLTTEQLNQIESIVNMRRG